MAKVIASNVGLRYPFLAIHFLVLVPRYKARAPSSLGSQYRGLEISGS
jgi:hypothetical protein